MADNRIMEEIFKTIDIITDHKLYQTEYLYTEDCTIVARTPDPYMYRIQHEQQEFEAHSPIGEKFEVGETVAVMFMDYSRITKKIILYGTSRDKKISSFSALDSFGIEGSPYIVNGITYGSYLPTLNFKIDPSNPGNYNSAIRMGNPFGANSSYWSAINLYGYFYDANSANTVVHVPEFFMTGTASFDPISGRVNGSMFSPYSSNKIFNTSVPLDIGTGTSTPSSVSYLTRYYYNGGSGAQFLGGVGMTGIGISLYTNSDYRLKENVSTLTGGLQKINSLNPVSWNWKDSAVTAEGFLAHEAKDVIPYSVVGEKDKIDVDGNPVYQQMDLTKIIPSLVSAIQELTLEIENLKSQINKGEG